MFFFLDKLNNFSTYAHIKKIYKKPTISNKQRKDTYHFTVTNTTNSDGFHKI